MKSSRFTESQIVSILKEADAGARVKEICRRHGISDATFYNWNGKYGGNERLGAEAAQGGRRGTVAVQADVCRAGSRKPCLEGSDREKVLRPLEKRDAAQFLVAEHGLSRPRACAAMQLSRSSWYRRRNREHGDGEVIAALNALVEKHPRWGFWKCHDRLRPLGHPWNHKRVYRVYKMMKLNLPRRTTSSPASQIKTPISNASIRPSVMKCWTPMCSSH